MLGPRSEFGMNIFEPYRGGESGYLMCQLLRVYRQTFDITFFEVDAHQFGLDNPDGIDSGAFWFYYKYGFRPMNRAIAALARKEKARLVAGRLTKRGLRRSLRTPKAMLRKFTGSNVALQFADLVPPALTSISDRVTRMIRRDFKGDRVTAEQECVQRFVEAVANADVAPLRRLNVAQRAVLAEMAFVACALNVADAKRLALLTQMVLAKPVDVYGYQQRLTEFLSV